MPLGTPSGDTTAEYDFTVNRLGCKKQNSVVGPSTLYADVLEL